jgi:type II secretory pathway component PulK
MAEGGTAKHNRAGIVLVLVLVLVGLIAGLALNMLYLSRVRHRTKSSSLDSARLRAALTDEALQALQRLADDEDLRVDWPGENWARVVEYKTPDNVAIWCRTGDLNARFDINNIYIESFPAQQELKEGFMDFLTYFGDYRPINRVDALRDWVDPDTEGPRETAWYKEQEYGYACPDTWLNSFAELCLVEGFSRDYLTADRELPLAQTRSSLIEAVTILPGMRRSPVAINVNTAPPLVLRAYAGMGGGGWVDYLLTARAAQPLAGLNGLLAVVDEAVAVRLRQFLAVQSSFFQVTVKGFLNNRAEELQVLARRDSTSGDIHVLRWVMN